MAATELGGHLEHLARAPDLPAAGVGVGLGEVRRVAQHRQREPAPVGLGADSCQVARVGGLEEQRVQLDAVDVERPGQLDPFEHRHAPVVDRVEEALREGGKARHILLIWFTGRA